MVSRTYKELVETRKPKDKVFAVRRIAFASVPAEHWQDIVPIEGVLESSYHEHSKEGPYPPRHLAPVNTDSSHPWDDPWWNIEDWIVCDSKEEAEKEIETQMRAAIVKAKEQIHMMELLLPSVKAEEKDDRGEFKETPAYRRDMSMTYEEIISRCTVPEPKDTYDGDLFTFDNFERAVRMGGITDNDGFGDLVIDGMVYDNIYVCCDMKFVMFSDIYVVPFTRLRQVFEGHELEFMWYNK